VEEVLTPEEKRALQDAVEKKRKDELFESSLARQIKNRGLSYESYIRLISDVRDIAKQNDIELEEAAWQLSSQDP
jgi:hypothetical protein